MPFAFGSPAAVGALLVCVPVVWFATHSYRRFTALRRRLTTTVRAAGLVLLALALSGFRMQRPTEALATVFLVDESASVTPDARRGARAFIAQAVRAAQPGDRFAVAAFGREPIVALGWSHDPDLPPLRVSTDRTATNLSEALDLGLALLPDDRVGRIVLVSDGRETHGDASGLAGLVRWRGASVDVVPLTAAGGADAAVVAVDVPAAVEPGAPVPVRIELQSNAVLPAVVRVYRNDAFWKQEDVTLIVGATTLVYEDRAGQGGTVVYRVEIEAAADAVPENGRGLGFTRVAARPLVWIVDGDGTGAQLESMLAARDLASTVVAPAALPENAGGYADIRSVVLANVSAATLSERQQLALATAVRDFGTGLVMLGNDRSFGPGGWRRTPVEDVLPVTMESTRPREGTVGIVLVMDVSGSMNQEVEGRPRLRFAQDAALGAYQVADPETLIGIVVFSGRARTLLPLARRPRDVNVVVPTLQRLRADGGTNAVPAIRLAVEQLTASEATTRHIIFMTDGEFHDRDAVASLYPALKVARISLSTIGAGTEVDTDQLREMAAATGGIFYPYTRAAALPAVFAEDTMQLIRNPIVRGPLVPVPRHAGPAIRNVNWSSAPLLDAMISTTVRDAAQLLVSSPDQDPLVASWRVGLATTAVLCTDLGGPFTPAWRDWPARPTVLESLVRATLPPPNTAAFSADLRVRGDEAVIAADAVDATGAFLNGLELEATLAGPDNRARVVALRQVGPGRYEVREPITGVGLFVAQVRDRSDAEGGRQWASAALPYPAEFAPGAGGEALLRSVAEATGGRVLTEPSQAFRRPPEPTTVRTDLWPWLTAAALCLFPFDVALRRFGGGPRAAMRVDRPTSPAPTSAQVRPARTRSRRLAPQAEPVSVDAAPPERPAPATDTPDSTTPPPAGPQSGPDSTMSRLLEAKRRAREGERDDAS